MIQLSAVAFGQASSSTITSEAFLVSYSLHIASYAKSYCDPRDRFQIRCASLPASKAIAFTIKWLSLGIERNSLPSRLVA